MGVYVLDQQSQGAQPCEHPAATGRIRRGLSALLLGLCNRAPVNKRLLRLIWPFLAIVVLLVLLTVIVTDILSAARAFVEGESRWSKAQKESVFHLQRYAENYSELTYKAYLENISVPKKLGEARVELDKDRPDYARAWRLLHEGGDHPNDINGVIRLYRNFRHVWYIAEIARVWEEGDRHIGALEAAADKLHRVITSGDRDPAHIKPLVDEILTINARLTPFEITFSNTLGDANRLTKLIILVLTLTIAATLVPLGAYFSQRMMNRGDAAESRLKLSEERFQLAVSGSNDGLWDWNLATDEWYFSPRLLELLGYQEDEIIGSWSVFIAHLHEEDRELVNDALQLHLQQGRPYDIEIRLRTKSGNYRWVRTRGRSVRDASGIAIRMAGAITDITEKKIAAAELFSEKERAQVTLASIGDGVITTDINGAIEYVNPVAEDLTGWRMVDAKGVPLPTLLRLIDEPHRRPVPNPIQMVLQQDRTIESSP